MTRALKINPSLNEDIMQEMRAVSKNQIAVYSIESDH
jgi:hypothetical protein